MKIISVINYKGGVGKTTLTANLAAELAWRKKNVLMIDLDPQCSLIFSFIRPEAWAKDFENGKTIKSYFDQYDASDRKTLTSLIHTPKVKATRLSSHGQFDLIPSHLGLLSGWH